MEAASDLQRSLDQLDGRVAEWGSRLRLPGAALPEVKGIVCSALGAEWLRLKALPVSKSGTFLPSRRHVLGEALAWATPQQVVMLFELAAYLRSLAFVPGVEEVISSLKAQFEKGLLQLAKAYRFQRAGGRGLRLEPVTTRGKADIAFEFEDHGFVVECYQPDGPDGVLPRSAEDDRLVAAVREGLEKTDCDVRIRLKRPLSASDRKRLAWRILRDLRAVGAGIEIDDEAARVDLRPWARCPRSSITHADPSRASDGADVVLYSEVAPVPALRNAPFGDYDAETTGRVLLWRATGVPLPPKRRADWLVERLGPKVRQTATPERRRRIVVVEAREGRQRNAADVDVIREVQQRVMPMHDRLSMIVFTDRCWDNHWHRFRYPTAVATGPDEDLTTSHLFQALKEGEHALDVLDGLR